MIKKIFLFQVLFLSLAVAGCVPLIVGAGSGAVVYSYTNGNLKASYPAAFVETTKACIDTLDYLQIQLVDKTSTGIKTTLNAKRSDGSPVTIEIVMLAPLITEVSVRTGVVGVWNKKNSELIHASIAQRL
ncbi:MAG: hypothetical protein B6I22_08980 [Desulfobacteraceae bacterium 4572_123]|nr:MAG: hypothetical protein B6I22_08980 [Desulfobacteraceae bacterium 4572_123]